MIRRKRALNALALSAAAIAPLAMSAQAQDFGERSMKPQFPVEKHPKVDEKAYKAALEKIPVPAEKYDPWAGARPADPQKSDKKSR